MTRMARPLAALLSVLTLSTPATAIATEGADGTDGLVMISATSITLDSTEQTVTAAVVNLGDTERDVEAPAPIAPGSTVLETSGDGEYDVDDNEWEVTVAPRATARRTFIVMR